MNIEPDSKLYIAGIRIDSDGPNPQFYTVYLDSEKPLNCEGCPIIFFDLKNAVKAREVSDCGCNDIAFDSVAEYAYIDIAQAVCAIGSKDTDPSSDITNSLNTLLDFVSFLHEDRTQHEYCKRMKQAAVYFTFNSNINSFFESVDYTRIQLVQAIEWSIGATLLWTKYVY